MGMDRRDRNMRQRRYLLAARQLAGPGLGVLVLAAFTLGNPVVAAQDNPPNQTTAACGLATGLDVGDAVETGNATTGAGDTRAAAPAATGESTPAMAGGTTGMLATPDATEMASFDQQFIDMAIPHHATIVSAAGAALIRIEDPELRAVTLDIILDQSVEVDKLRDLRMRLVGSTMPMPIDMTMMSEMPGMTGVDPAGMAQQMDPAAFTALVCSAPEADLGFIDLTITHHQVAVLMGQAAMEQATDPVLQALATHSVLTQQAQIAELQQIRDRLAASGT